jgi:hypothetical protein
VELGHVGTLEMFCHVESVIGWAEAEEVAG